MANPIIWPIINAPSNSDASQMMSAASNSFNNAFAGLQGTLQQNDQLEARKFDKQKILNTQSYLNQVDELGKTPEQLQAAIQTGALDKLRQSFGDNIDHAAVRGAGEALLTQRYTQAKAANEYSHMAADARTAPIADQYKALMIKGDPDSVAKAGELFNQYRALGGRSESSLVAFGDERGQVGVQRDRDTTKFNQGTAAHENVLKKSAADITHMETQDRIAQQQADTSSASVTQQGKLINEQVTNMQEGRLNAKALHESTVNSAKAAALKNRLSEEGNIYAEGVYTGKQAGDLAKLLVDNKIGGEGGDAADRRANLIAKFASGTIDINGPGGKKITVPIPYSALKAVALSSTSPLWATGWNKGTANEAERQLKEIMQATYKGADGKDRNVSQDQFTEYQNATQRMADNPAVNTKAAATSNFKKKVMK